MCPARNILKISFIAKTNFNNPKNIRQQITLTDKKTDSSTASKNVFKTEGGSKF